MIFMLYSFLRLKIPCTSQDQLRCWFHLFLLCVGLLLVFLCLSLSKLDNFIHLMSVVLGMAQIT